LPQVRNESFEFTQKVRKNFSFRQGRDREVLGLAADRPEGSSRLKRGAIVPGHVLSETAGACRVSEKLNRSPERGFPKRISGFSAAASIDGERPDFTGGFPASGVVWFEPSDPENGCAPLQWGQALRRREDLALEKACDFAACRQPAKSDFAY
jgi:hypothetical protein